VNDSIAGRAPPASAGSAIEGVWKLEDVERAMILRALAAAHGNKAEPEQACVNMKKDVEVLLERGGYNA
jgi:hypothetical protein